jgi:hypothetical protein
MTYTEEEEEEPGIEQQVINLRKKMEDVVNIAAALANGTDLVNATATNDIDSSTEVGVDGVGGVGVVGGVGGVGVEGVGGGVGGVGGKKKRMSFREKQERRMSDRR